MTIDPLTSSIDVPQVARGVNNTLERDFGSYINSTGKTAKVIAQKSDDELRLAAEQLVSTAFVMPLLKQMREDPLRADLFHGGTGEDMFSQQLDQSISDNIVGKSRWPLVDAVYNAIKRPEVDVHG